MERTHVLLVGPRAATWLDALSEAGFDAELPPCAPLTPPDHRIGLWLWDAGDAAEAHALAASRAETGRVPTPVLAIASTEAEAEIARLGGADEVVPPWRASIVSAVGRALERDALKRELVKAEISLESMSRAAKHREMFFAMSLDMLCIADFEGYFKQLNPAWSALGWTFDELQSRPFLEFVHPDDVASTLEIMGLLTSSDYSTVSFENRYRCKDGSYRWLQWSSRTTHLAARPEDRLYCAVARDITERRLREEELRVQAVKLERSNADLEQFAHIASHDLQEPLRMVSSYVSLLAKRYKGQLDAQADKYIHYAVDGAQRMHGLINDLLAYSRVTSQGLALEPTDAGKVLDRAVADLRLALTEAGADVEVGPMPTVQADAGQLRQVFQNLIGNGLKFHRADAAPVLRVFAEAVVEADQPTGEWRFSVQDNGIGIAPQHFDRIFELFQRLHGRGEYSGTGLGLAIVKKVVERHGGRIWLASEPEVGTTFFFTLQGIVQGAPP